MLKSIQLTSAVPIQGFNVVSQKQERQGGKIVNTRTLKIICVAIIASNVCYYRLVTLLGEQLQKNAGAVLAQWTPICSGLAILALIVAALIALRKIRLRSESVELITALILAESATAFFGLLLVFLGLPPEKFFWFLGGTLLVQLVVIAPQAFERNHQGKYYES